MKTLDDCYKSYKKSRIPRIKKGEIHLNMPKTEYRNICYAFNKKLMEYFLEGGEVHLPKNLGSFRIKKSENNWEKLMLDYKHFNATGEKKFLTNDHSNNFLARFHWRKNHRAVKNLSSYHLKLARSNKRAIAAVFKAGHHNRFMK